MSARLERAAALVVAAAAAAVAGCGGQRKELAGGPYVQDVTSSTAIVAVVTPGPERLALRWTAPDGAGGEVREAEPVQVHGLQATGLAPATTYRYVVEGAEGGARAEATFRTAPGATATRVSFLVIGDSGGTEDDDGPVLQDAEEAYERATGVSGDEDQQGKVVAAMLARDPDLVLHLGDVVYPAGAREDYAEAFFRPFAPLICRVPLYPTLGNHDCKTEGGAPYLETFFTPRNGVEADGRTYSFDWANVHFACVDTITSPYGEGSAQVAWLERDLAASDRPWKVVWWHVPAFSAGRAGENAALQEALVPVLARNGVDLCLTGHDHLYARFFPVGPVTYVTSGGGGKSLYEVRDDPRLAYAESVFHFLEVVVDGPELRLAAIDAAGRTFDALVLRKGR